MQWQDQRIKFSSNLKIDLVHGRRYKEYLGAVDCRLLFLGDHCRQFVQIYAEVVKVFSSFKDTQSLFEYLKSSEEIQKFYEVQKVDGKVSVLMKDSVFRRQGPMEGVDIELRISYGKKTWFRPLSFDRLKALGNLLPLLCGNYNETEIGLILKRRLSQDSFDWALELLEWLKHHQLVEPSTLASNYFLRSVARPRVTLLGHSSLLLQSRESALLVDPLLRFNFRSPRRVMDVRLIKLGAICCSHSHWDHCDLQTLLWFDKSTPIIIPKIQQPTAFNPPISGALKMLGFTDIREVELWEPVKIDDIELIPIPFHGEQDEPDAVIDHFTYILRTEGMTLYGGVDCYRDTYGEMKPVLEKVRNEYKPDIAFLPISKMIYDYKYGGVNGFCRYFDISLLDQSFQYTASVQDAAEWMDVLGVKWAVPYAIFLFSRFPKVDEVHEFAKSLKKIGLSKHLYPLRPLDSLEEVDLNGHRLSKIRRQKLLTLFLLGEFVNRFDRKLKSHRLYRSFRRRFNLLIAPLRP